MQVQNTGGIEQGRNGGGFEPQVRQDGVAVQSVVEGDDPEGERRSLE